MMVNKQYHIKLPTRLALCDFKDDFVNFTVVLKVGLVHRIKSKVKQALVDGTKEESKAN